MPSFTTIQTMATKHRENRTIDAHPVFQADSLLLPPPQLEDELQRNLNILQSASDTEVVPAVLTVWLKLIHKLMLQKEEEPHDTFYDGESGIVQVCPLLQITFLMSILIV
jgi:hypothetical protein